MHIYLLLGQYNRSWNKKGVYTHVFRVNEDNKTISEVIWCVAEKNSMHINAKIMEKLILLHMSLNRPIVDN